MGNKSLMKCAKCGKIVQETSNRLGICPPCNRQKCKMLDCNGTTRAKSGICTKHKKAKK